MESELAFGYWDFRRELRLTLDVNMLHHIQDGRYRVHPQRELLGMLRSTLWLQAIDRIWSEHLVDLEMDFNE